MKWFLLWILNSFEWCICHLQCITERERFLGDVHCYLEKMFSTFNQPVQFILSNQMEVNNFLIELTSASISKGQPGLNMLFWLKRASLSFYDFLKCKYVSSKSRKIVIVQRWQIASLCALLWLAKGFSDGYFLTDLCNSCMRLDRQDCVCPFYRCRQKLAKFIWFVKGCRARN